MPIFAKEKAREEERYHCRTIKQSKDGNARKSHRTPIARWQVGLQRSAHDRLRVGIETLLAAERRTSSGKDGAVSEETRIPSAILQQETARHLQQELQKQNEKVNNNDAAVPDVLPPVNVMLGVALT